MNSIRLTTTLMFIFSSIFAIGQSEHISFRNLCNPGATSPPEELNRKRLSEPGMKYGNPYTMFYREGEFDLAIELTQIRSNIKKGEPFHKNFIKNAYSQFYVDLYVLANEPSPCDCANNDVCPHPKWVKSNAIIYLIGLRPVFVGDTIHFETMTNEDQDYYGKRAYDGLTRLNPSVISCWGGKDCGKVRQKAFDLIQYLQAYDLLKTGGYIEPYAEDRNLTKNNKTGEKVYITPRDNLRAFARNLYKESEIVLNSKTGWKKNHGIICASALGLSALVLNDAGVETDFFNTWYSYIPIIGQIIRLIAEPLPHPNYSPINWMKRSYGTEEGRGFFHPFGEDGIEDNFFVGDHGAFWSDVPQSSADGLSGYAEGPGYFSDLSQAFFVYLRAASNDLPSDNSKNLLTQTKYRSILTWYQNILNQDNSNPSYDNSGNESGNFMGILGVNGFPSNSKFVPGSGNIDLRGDYILALGAKNGNNDLPKYYYNEKSGNIILRNQNKYSNQTFHMLCEKDNAIDIPASEKDGTHEDDDLGSFMIYVQDAGINAKNVPLAIDPAYFGWGTENSTNHYFMHNVVEICAGANMDDRIYKYPKFNTIKDGKNGYLQDFELTYDFKLDKNGTLYGNAISRNVMAINLEENIYYIINDFVNAEDIPDFDSVKLNINGNGNKFILDGDDSMTFRKTNNLYQWAYPCKLDNSSWRLTAGVATFKSRISGFETNENFYTKNADNGIGTRGNGISGDYHTKLVIGQAERKTIFQTFLYPQKCNVGLPIVKTNETSYNYVSTDINFIAGKDTSFEARLHKNTFGNLVNDTSCNLHIARWEGNISDSLSNPFNLTNQATNKLYFNSQKAFINYHTLSYFDAGSKYCPPSYSNFRILNITNGSYLIYKDTLVFSDVPVNLDYALNGYQNYVCKIQALVAVSSGDSIKLKLPDVTRGVDMIAIKDGGDILNGRYDSLTNYFYLALPSVSTGFTIRENQTCKDCYFPLPGAHIDTLFEADDKYNRHTLGHSMNINYPHGNLSISNSAHINLCAGVYLLNKDSLIIEGPPQDKALVIPTCSGIDSIAKASDNSMLIVSPGGALVLNAGSRTYVKNGGAIYVAQNGSLVIKDGSFLQIGDSGIGGWGEIIAEPGAYIYIEPDAHIEYRRTIGDTADRNIFSIAVGNSPAYPGVYFFMDSILKAEGIIAPTIFPTAICDLDSLFPIANREWGYTNFGMPKPLFQVANDTLCPGEPLYIKMNRILNDASAQITVCRWDSIFNSHGVFLRMECVNDSIALDSLPPDPICRLPRILPDEWAYYFEVNSRHQVTISVYNECGRRHDTSVLIVVLDTPQFDLDVPTTACEGYKTVKVLATESSHDSVLYAFEVTEMIDTNSIAYQIGNPGEVYSYSHYGILPDTFDFPDYYFRGGRRYLVSLSISNGCGTKTIEGEVNIPSGVYIQLERPNVYADPVYGARSVQLHGYVSIADSFRWEPKTWLDYPSSLVLNSTPENSISYVLIARYGDCLASDTAFIKYNHVANAGTGDTVCYTGNKVLLGNPYDFSLLLGLIYLGGRGDFRSSFISQTTGNNAYFRYFTHFMLTDDFRTWATGCSNLYNRFTNDLYRDSTVLQPWFKQYYENLIQFNNPEMTDLDSFVSYLSLTPSIRDNYSSLARWSDYSGCISTLLSQYDYFVSTQLSSISVNWSKVVGSDTTALTDWNEYFIALDEPGRTAVYIQNVITPNYAEIDEIKVFVDTVLTPGFTVQIQFDSSVIFTNTTQPTDGVNIYDWDFGDGSAHSTEEFPMHTFAAMDTFFRVCLTATNRCDNWTYCDTVYVDSAHWGGSFFVKKSPKYGLNTNDHNNLNPEINKQVNEQISKGEIPIALTNYPNPFGSNTIIEYEIWQSYSIAELRITNIFGQTVFEQKLLRPIDKLQMDGSALNDGLYYYSIIMDGSVKQTKTMAVIH